LIIISTGRALLVSLLFIKKGFLLLLLPKLCKQKVFDFALKCIFLGTRSVHLRQKVKLTIFKEVIFEKD